MATVQVQVEVEMNDFSDNELINEIEYRAQSNRRRSKDRLKSLVTRNMPFKIESLPDQLKWEFICENWDKINLEKLEKCTT